ncbi:unnamed protein product, partial [Pylaiella littoralis]
GLPLNLFDHNSSGSTNHTSAGDTSSTNKGSFRPDQARDDGGEHSCDVSIFYLIFFVVLYFLRFFDSLYEMSWMNLASTHFVFATGSGIMKPG